VNVEEKAELGAVGEEVVYSAKNKETREWKGGKI
jgi:hypothetical protein